ncbi:hypothetical protein LSH36_427g01042 [Paralvinella palmiformis]|uniref:MyTH4 domain-containing protein n=1 Tax=Paralvinella palmiformis TaxID=53620 RepID=A0AAD9MYC6_9ANNE|nr:hypothetical protein LSH36_427g01042 [Paralvinella palmiformis]
MTSASETSSRRGYSVDGGLMPSGDLRVLSRPGRASFERSEDGWIRRDLFMYGNKENRPLMDGSGTGVRQQQQPPPPHVGPTESVPLAEMDDFSESLCMSSDESTKRCSRTDSDSYLTNRDGVSLDGNTTSGDEADVSSLVAATGSAKVAKRKRKSKNRRGKTVRNERPPRPGECGTLVDERASVSSMYKWWLNQIEEQDNLERCYFSGHNDKSHKDSDYAMIEFAERYYNNHYIFFGYSSALTKTVNIVRRKSFTEVVPLEDMLKWPKSSSIPTSHVHLLEAEDVIQACSIFKDLYRYVKGEVKGEIGVSLIRSLMAKAKDRVELRDEMYCQLLRLSNANPSLDNTLRAWAVMAVCSVAFTPSHTLLKYFISYLRQHCDDSEEFPFSAKVKPYAQYCLQHVTSHRQAPRQRVPSLVEIQVLINKQRRLVSSFCARKKSVWQLLPMFHL